MHRPKQKSGYSLIEIIMYVAILAGITVIVVNMLIRISHSKERVISAQRVTTSAGVALDRMMREIYLASGVSTTSSILGTSPGKLVLTGSESGSGYTIEFSVLNGGLRIIKNSVDLGPLTQSGVTVTNLIFRRSASSTAQAISIEFTLESGTSTNYKSEKFYTTAVLRQSL